MRFLILLAMSCVATFALMSNASSEGSVTKITLNNTNFVAIRDKVDDLAIDNVFKVLLKSDPKEPFYLYLDSPGGSVFAGRRLVSYLLTTDRNVVCIANTAISMAYVILQACPVRLITNHSVLMTHQIASQLQGSLKEMQNQLVMVEKLALLYDSFIASRMGLTLEEYRTKVGIEWWMMGVKDALLNKAADKEVKVNCSTDLEKQTEKINDTTFSKCPIS